MMDALALKAGMSLKDADYPERIEHMRFLARVRDNKQYDHIPNPFSMERDGNGAYVPVASRRPSVRSGICRVVVNNSVSLLFGDGHFPAIHTKDEATRSAIANLVHESRLCQVMTDAAVKGSVGSVVVFMRVLDGRYHFEVKDTTWLWPIWSAKAPDRLSKVIETYKISGRALNLVGYNVQDDEKFWFRREWTETEEVWFRPQPVADAKRGDAPIRDDGRSVTHALGFVPMVWITNLPGGDEVDGICTFEPAITTVCEIDYQLSQAGRGLKYSSDPTLLIKEPAGADGEIVKSAGNALVVSEKGDAKLLEIGGTASAAVIEYVRMLRETALEAMGGNRTNVDKLNGNQSGRAMEMMNQGLVWLADALRSTYGEGLLSLIRMACSVSQAKHVTIKGRAFKAAPEDDLTLVWPRFFPPSYDEKFAEANAYATMTGAGIMSRERAVTMLAPDNDVADVTAELALIEKDMAEREAREMRQKAQVKATEAG